MEICLGDSVRVVFNRNICQKSSFERYPAPPNRSIATNLIPTDKRGNVCSSYWYRLLNQIKVKKYEVIGFSSLIKALSSSLSHPDMSGGTNWRVFLKTYPNKAKNWVPYKETLY